MSQADLEPIYLKDYAPPAFLADTAELTFDLDPAKTRVVSRVAYRRNPAATVRQSEIVLNGEHMDLVSVALDGASLTQDAYDVTDDALCIPDVPDSFILEIETAFSPQDNKALEGLYVSSGRFCTQCEPEGFRRITYFLDRPDVLSTFTVKLIANAKTYPQLLSNGNLRDAGPLDDGRHYAMWEDPFPKPCYLFALVAGDLARLHQEFATRSGKTVDVNMFVEHGKEAQAEYAMDCLLRAMTWDEDVYGLEYDLDEFNVVAVSDFNMGAMENKSLNIFNDKLLLADPDTATDDDYARIESVVAHEYFHNWTGNRVTCRDWFQLSLKEGLTVFRDQQFSEDARSAAVQRIGDVGRLRMWQFPEDAGPLAHPVRPESYAEINNFYTHTVYEKGAEVVRMVHALLGADTFRRGMDVYFERHDGQAVTCEDFVAAMEAASGTDLSQFMLWYRQAGTPKLKADYIFDSESGCLRLTIDQSLDPTPGQDAKSPMHIPLTVGVVDRSLGAVKSRIRGDNGEPELTHTISLTETRTTVELEGIDSAAAAPSLNRGFSAPVNVDIDLSAEDLAATATHDPDAYAKWNARQELALRVLVGDIEGQDTTHERGLLISGMRATLEAPGDDLEQAAALQVLPSGPMLEQRLETINPLVVHQARTSLRHDVATELTGVYASLYDRLTSDAAFSPDPASVGRRALRNAALFNLAVGSSDGAEIAYRQFREASNMTDRWAALEALNHTDAPERQLALDEFHNRFKDNALVLDKWLTMEAAHPRAETLDRVRSLLDHASYDSRNPNRIRALLATFAFGNAVSFHQESGEGYKFIADRILEIDGFNPQSAARLAGAFQQWARYGDGFKDRMKQALQSIASAGRLSQDVKEIVVKSLDQ